MYKELARPEDTLGALDMGGASTQITFYSSQHETIPAEYKEDLQLYGKNFSVYTHSYLCYGINEAVRRYQAHLVKVSACIAGYQYWKNLRFFFKIELVQKGLIEILY